MSLFYFERQPLLEQAKALRDEFEDGHPFPHVVIDDFLPADVLETVAQEFPEPGHDGWRRREQAHERKLGLSDEERLGPQTRHLIHDFNSQVFVDFLEELTGIGGLLPDPHLVGGGLHQVQRGGLLKVHADFNRHKRLALDRRLNVLVYLNHDWKDDYGGHLELWDRSMTRCVRRVLPVFNRCVIFATTDHANHGHPEPLTCPEDRARRSMALYYYTSGSDGQEAEAHTTLFKERPSERIRPRRSPQRIARRVLPPVVYDGLRTVRGRLGR